MLQSWKMWGIALLTLGCVISAQALPPWQEKNPILPEKQAFKIPQSDFKGVHTLTLPSITPKDGMAVILRFDARGVYSDPDGGWNPWFSMELNGHDIGKYTRDGMPRLLRRGENMLSSIEPVKDWWTSLGNHTRLMLFFAKEDSPEPDKRMLSAREEGFTYTLDVTDLLNYNQIGADDRVEGGKPNQLTFTYWLPESSMKAYLAVKNLQFYYLPESELMQQGGVVLTEFKPTKPVAEIKANGGSIAVSAQGGLTIQSNQETFYLESHYSYPADPKMKFHNFTVGTPEADDAFQVTVKSEKSGSVTVQGKAAEYQITRTLTPNGHRVEVRDAIRNLSKDDLGIAWNHTIARSGVLPEAGTRLAGQSGASRVTFFGTSNPTLFAAGKNGSVGLVAEDTVSRAQLDLGCAGNVMRMGSMGMGIPKEEEVVLDWVIYVRPEGDYYDFINQLRKDWKVNYTIDGPYAGHEWALPVKSATVKPLPPWFEYLSADGMNDEKYAEKVKPLAEAARKVKPDVKLLGMLETNLVELDTRTLPWGEELKPRRGSRNEPGIKYGLFMTPEQTKKLDAVSPYRDCVVRDRNGNAMYENYYASYPFINLMVQPEFGNERYKQFMRQIDFMMDTVGLNGVYIDQFIPYTIGGFSENRWDGRTVALDEAGRIENKRYSYAITGAAARAEIIRKVRAKGGIVVTNGQPASKEEQTSGVFAFQEMENDPVDPRTFLDSKPPECKWQVVSHLGSPIVLGLRPRRYGEASDGMFPRYLTKGIITGLRNGVLFYYYTLDITLEPGPNYGSTAICDNMYPFTPKALHEGWIEGEERTITAISGTYAIGGKNKPTVLSFDERGFEKPNKFAVTGKPGNWQVEVKLNDWNEVAIMIVRD